MKSDFSKYTVFPSRLEREAFSGLVDAASHFLGIHAGNVLEFIEGDLSARMTDAIAQHIRLWDFEANSEASPDQVESFHNSVGIAIEANRARFEKEFSAGSRSKISTDQKSISFRDYDQQYLKMLAERVNKQMSAVAVQVANAAMSIMDDPLRIKTPSFEYEVLEARERQNNPESLKAAWSKKYQVEQPARERERWVETYRDISMLLFLNHDEVFYFLYDYLSWEIYENVADNVFDLTRRQREKFSEYFDDRMDDVKNHFADVIKQQIETGRIDLSADDPRWGDYASNINLYLQEIAMDLTYKAMALTNEASHMPEGWSLPKPV